MSKENPLRILAVSHDSDTVIDRTLDRLAASGDFAVTIASPEGQPTADTTHCRHIATAPVKGKANIKAANSLRRAIKECKAEIVLAISSSALATALNASPFTGARVIGYRGTQHHISRFDPTYYLALLNPRVAHVLCETADIYEYMLNFKHSEKLTMLTKPYELSWVDEAMAHPLSAFSAEDIRPAKRNKDGKAPLEIVYVGATAGRPHKGLHHLIGAMKLLNERGVNARLTVVGRSSDEDMASAPENVVFTGNRRDAIHFMAAADLFVLPSTRDASPRVLREAQACGLPCVVSDIPGARDLIIAEGEKQTGVLVKPADAVAIADAVAALAADPAKMAKMSRNARLNIEDNYSFDQYVKGYAEMFRHVARRR